MKKFVSVVLIAAILCYVAGCSGKSIDYAEIFDDMGYDELDKFDSYRDFDDGAYISTDSKKYVKKLIEGEFSDFYDFKAGDLSSVFYASKQNHDGAFLLCAFVFEDEDDAQDSLEYMMDYWEDWSDDLEDGYYEVHDEEIVEVDQFESDEDDDYYVIAFQVDDKFTYVDMFLDKNTLSFVYGEFESQNHVYEDYAELYENIERDCPVELLDDEPND